MKILWITNSPFPDVYRKLNSKAPVTVGWVYSSAQTLMESYGNIELAVASFYKGKTFEKVTTDKIENFLIPEKLRKNIEGNKLDYFWEKINSIFNPDIVHIHGTEYLHSYSYVRACGARNVVVSIQGLVSIYERYYFGNISKVDLKRSVTLRDILRFDTIFSQYKNMNNRGKYEQFLLKHVDHVIGRTTWDQDHVWALNPSAKYHFCNETLRQPFYENQWDIDKCERHSIFISQAQYPIKGFHQLVSALPIVLKHFPQTKVYVAGHNFFSNRGIRLHGFGKYVNNLIRKNSLEKHIVFTGLLTENEMCRYFMKSHIFVCPSSIENSPNSVGESQLLGVPCIASYVGGTPDMIKDGYSGLLYRFEEIEMLAHAICRIFSNEKLAQDISNNSRIVATKRHDKKENASKMHNIYQDIIKQQQ